MPYIDEEEGRITLNYIKVKHKLNTIAIANIASVEPYIVWKMENRSLKMFNFISFKRLGSSFRLTHCQSREKAFPRSLVSDAISTWI